MPDPQQIQVPSGLVAVTTYGPLRHETALALMEARSFNEKNGLANLQYTAINAVLVDKARNEAARQCLKAGHGFLFFVDGDMVFPPDGILRLLQTAYGEMPYADVVGGWCPLRGELSLPTTDFGSGTWESSFPGSGTKEVMRTGGAFLLIKRRVLEGLADPWFRMRVPMRPADAMEEVSCMARQKFNGQNPFEQMPEWDQLLKTALADPSIVAENFIPVEVGEDSSFHDRARHAGFRIFVNTDVACGHVDSIVRTWVDHKRGMESMEQQQRYAVGLLT